MSMVGYREWAYSIPRTSFLPPAAFWPEVGSKTPTLMTLSPLEAGALLLPLSLPHAHRANTIISARASAIIFFISFSSISVSPDLCPRFKDTCIYQTIF